MHPDDESQTTLSKWPFIIGDVLLVATALAIAILGNWQLTNWQVGACVAAVALGAALFILPYIVEFQVRVREELEDRAADLRIIEKHLLVAEQAIDASDTRIRALESAAAEADSPNAALVEAMDHKIAQLEAARAAQVEVIQALQKDLENLAAKEPPPTFDPEVLKLIEKRLKTLEDKPARVVEAPAPKKEAPPAAKEEAPEPPKPAPEKVEPKPSDSEPKPEKTQPPEPEKKAAPIERPKREARERHGPEESRLLKRAISEKGDKSSTAVSRIIESKVEEKEKTAEAPKEPESPEPEPEKEEPAKELEPKEKEAPKDEKPEPEKEEAKQEEAKPKADAEKEEPKAQPVAEKPKPATEKPEATVDNDNDSDKHLEPESKPAPKVAKKEEPTVEPEAKPESKPAKKEEPKVEKKPDSQDDAIDLDAEVPAMDSSDMLFDDAAVGSPIKKTKAKKNDAVLTASVFIGIGNKPYLRGSGGGLNWEKGQLMEFQEIGKWRWVAPSDLEAPLELQIYRNDEDPDKSGKCTLEPGQKLEVTPVF